MYSGMIKGRRREGEGKEKGRRREGEGKEKGRRREKQFLQFIRQLLSGYMLSFLS